MHIFSCVFSIYETTVEQTAAPELQKFEVCVTKYCSPLNFWTCLKSRDCPLISKILPPIYFQNPKSSIPFSKRGASYVSPKIFFDLHSSITNSITILSIYYRYVIELVKFSDVESCIMHFSEFESEHNTFSYSRLLRRLLELGSIRYFGQNSFY